MGRKEKILTVTPPLQTSCPSPPPPQTTIISKRTYTRQISNNSNSNHKKTENALVSGISFLFFYCLHSGISLTRQMNWRFLLLKMHIEYNVINSHIDADIHFERNEQSIRFMWKVLIQLKLVY